MINIKFVIEDYLYKIKENFINIMFLFIYIKMVSEKVVVVLIILAILLSIVSVVVTVASVNAPKLPKIEIKQGTVFHDADAGQVSLVINKPTP